MNRLKVYIADEHAILRDGLKRIIAEHEKFHICGDSGDGRTALEDIDRLKPHLVVMGIALPTMTGFDVVRQLKKYHPNIKIIILTHHDSAEQANKLLKYGVDAYILKHCHCEELIRGLEEVMKGNMYLSPSMVRKLMNDYATIMNNGNGVKPETNGTTISEREKQVIKLISEGHSNNKIAQVLHISPYTVKVHRYNIMQKLKVSNTVDLVKYAIREGLIEI